MELQAIEEIWNSAGGAVVHIPEGTTLWHGGIIGPSNPMTEDHLLWTTQLEDAKDLYDNQAREFAKFMKLRPYRLELVLKETLRYADFKAASLQQFTMKHCNCQHGTMKKFLKDWVSSKNLAGVVAINGGSDEVLVRNPHLVLQVAKMTPL